MKVRRRTNVDILSSFDVRYIEETLKGQYDNIYFIFTTLENEPTDAWEEDGDSFLLINIPKEKVLNATIDYKAVIIRHIPKLSWLKTEELKVYINDRFADEHSASRPH